MGTIVTIALGAIAAFFAALTYYGTVVKPAWREELEHEDPKYRQRIKAELASEHRLADYKQMLARLEDDWFFKWQGERFSGRQFLWCTRLALIYPVAALYLSWAISGEISFSGRVLYPFDMSGSGRLLFVGFLAVWSIGLGTYLHRAREIMRWLSSRIDYGLKRLFGSGSALARATIAEFVTIAVFGFSIVSMGFLPDFLALLVADSLLPSFPFSVISTFAFLFVFISVGPLTLTSIVISFGVLPTVLYFALSGGSKEGVFIAQTLWVFFLVLPLANSTLDWMSWGLTRYFLRNAAAQEVGGKRVALDLLIDTILAGVCLLLLAGLLPLVIEISNLVFWALGLPELDWIPYLEAATDDPFGPGLMVWLMLFTTFLPTIIHIGATIGWAAYSIRPNTRRILKLFPQEGEEWDLQDLSKVIRTILHIRCWWLLGFVTAVGFTASLLYVALHTVGWFAELLRQMALCGAPWAGHGCALLTL